jgi:hypothetical protein
VIGVTSVALVDRFASDHVTGDAIVGRLGRMALIESSHAVVTSNALAAKQIFGTVLVIDADVRVVTRHAIESLAAILIAAT